MQLALIGILDDGWAGLSEAARTALQEADLILGVGRTLTLVQPHVPAAELRDMDGALGKTPGWAREAIQAGRNVAVLATGDPLCHGLATYLLGKIGPVEASILPAPSTLQIASARWQKPWQDAVIASCHGPDTGSGLKVPPRNMACIR